MRPAKLIFLFLAIVVAPLGLCAQTSRSEPSVDLLKSSSWEYSLDEGRSFSQQPPAVPAGDSHRVLARIVFTIAEHDIFADAIPYASLNLVQGSNSRYKASYKLNDKPVTGPLEGMTYGVIPGIDPNDLKVGKNTLEADFTVKGPVTPDLKTALLGLEASVLDIQTGPILGACGDDFFTVTCRTNMPATVKLAVDTFGSQHVEKTSEGLIHRFRIDDLKSPWQSYSLRAERGASFRTLGSKRGPRPAANKPPRFIIMGDSRTNSALWAKVAAAAGKTGPDFAVLVGDMAADGRDDALWDSQFAAPARDFLIATPVYAVIGNHEKSSPLFDELFYSPGPDGKSHNWTQTVGPVQLIGIDGAADWSAGGKNAQWLESTLQAGTAKFVFLVNHYPAWSSASHGALGAGGKPAEKTSAQARDVIVPLLVKYHATAYFAGHDHCYERSECPGGITHIITGGAGAPLYKKTSNAENQNPYSKVFASKLHYCLLSIDGDSCTMRAVTPEGDQIDTVTWKAR